MKKCAIYSSIAALMASTVAASAQELNVLTWEGYSDDSFIAAFSEASGCQVNATYVGSNDDFAPKLAAGGGVYDLITPSIDTTQLMIDAGFVEPIDTSKISEWDNIYPKFLNQDGIQEGGDYYGMPYTWGSIPFMYRNDKFETPPTSLASLFSSDLEGRISLWDDKSALYVAARMAGNMDIYNMSDADLEAAQAKLIEQKPLVRKYWATAGELVDLYAGGEVWISNTWGGYQSALLAEQGIEVTEFIPEEGAEGWMDSWMIVKGSPNQDCAYKFLNMQISEQGQCGVANVNGYSVANPVAAKACMSAEQFSALHQDDPDYLDSLLLWQPLGERLEAYTNAWNAVKAQ
ncbi:MAG: ABC transporter substrate-binding protein [Alphaproteobacteria bacterium]|nr:ABC transporter substrate-binding protein [Alphaproteobacteria bacterium]